MQIYCNFITRGDFVESRDIIVKDFSLNGSIYCAERYTLNAKPEKHYESSIHEFFEIYFFIKGDLKFAFEGEFIDIAPGDMVIISNGLLHRPMLKSVCTYHRKVISFTPEILIKSENGFNLYDILRTRKIIKITDENVRKHQLGIIFEKIHSEVSDPTAYNELCALINLSYFLITADSIHNSNREILSTTYNSTALEIIKYINDNIHTDLRYEAIAERFHFSENGLYKFFKKETGFTLGKYIRQRRIIKAKSVLNSGKSAQEAARESGFGDYSVFYRNFMKETNMTPIEYAKISPKITDKILIKE